VTKQISDPPGLRLLPLTDWMQENVADFDASSPLQATLLAGGRSNISYKLTDALGSSWVLRRPPLGHIMPSAHDMGREFRVLSGLNKVSFPTPTTRGHCEDESVIGAKFMMMDFVEHGSRDPFLYVSYADSYFQFVSKIESTLAGKLDASQLAILKLISNEINNGKRVEESELLKYLIEFGNINYEEFELKCTNVLSSGYEYFFKINSMLEILHIIDSSQTNKYKYEESLGFIPNMNTFLNSIHDIYIGKYELDIQKYISQSTIEKNSPTLISNYTEAFELKKSMLFIEKTNIFNHLINQYILLFIKISQNLKKIYFN
jgi:hypothetical protein